MKDVTLPATEFRAKCLRLLDEVATQGKSIVITKRGRPIAKVTPIRPPVRPLGGSWKGIVKVRGDIVHFSAVGE